MPERAHRNSSAGHAQAGLGGSDSWGVRVSHGPAHALACKRKRDIETIPSRGGNCEPTEPRLGTKLRVYWGAEGKWFDGVVDAKRKEQKRGRWIHHVTYTDGDDRWHHLPSMDWTPQLATKPKRAEAVMAAKRKSRPLHSSRPVKVVRMQELSGVEPSHAATAVASAVPLALAPNCRHRRLVREARRRVRRARGNAVQAKDECESLHEDAASLLALRSPAVATATEAPVPRCVEGVQRAVTSREPFEQLSPLPMLAGPSLVQEVVRFERTGIEAFVEAYDPVDGLHTVSLNGRSWREALVGTRAVAFTRVPRLPSTPVVVGVHVPTDHEFVEALHRANKGEVNEQCPREPRCSRHAGRKGSCNKVAAKTNLGHSTAVDMHMVACMSLLLFQRSVF